MLHDLESWGGRGSRGLALLVALLAVGGSGHGLFAQQALDSEAMVNVSVVVVDRHSTLDAPVVVVINPSWGSSDALVSIEAGALDASSMARGLRAVQRALAGGGFADREDVILSLSTLQSSTGEVRSGTPSPVQERAERAVAHFVPLVTARAATEPGRRGDPGPGMDVLGVTGFIASMHMTFPRAEISERGPRNPGR
jgi:hypothetical protein